MEKIYRNLTDKEISQLKDQLCTSQDWNRVLVIPDFDTEYIRQSRFSGDVKIGSFKKEFILEGGVVRHSGIYDAIIHNCTIGNDVFIENTTNYIANYNIGEGAFIQNVNLLVTRGVSAFGNGVSVAVLNETGGREVPIFNELTAHLAYIVALYRHNAELITHLYALIDKYVKEHSSDRGDIGKDVHIVNADTLRDIRIGDCCTIEGSSRLENGTINSNAEAPVFIGHNVVAEDFIVSSGANVTDGATLVRCFVGQACHLGHLFSAHDSLFFSNCQCENGEACAVFAGPYTVTMHKSSLLIAGMFSFLNAGSGSNQSNHMYKLGPIHQGIVERGSKTTSDSYILWPAKIGAFSLIMGRHVNHPDTSDLPFSYLIEQNGNSYLVPGVNLRSVGTIRDAQKWPKRDKRKDSHKLDSINFNLLSPYTIHKMMNGIQVLQSLKRISGETSEEYVYQSSRIMSSALQKGIGYYEMAIQKFLGNSLIKRLENIQFTSNDDIRRRLTPDMHSGNGEWCDLCGMIAPQTEINDLLNKVICGQVMTVGDINRILSDLHANYYALEWTWAYGKMMEWFDLSANSITADDIAHVVLVWKSSVIDLDKMLYSDAKKEFSMVSKTGFGADDECNKQQDFEHVRGAFENNPFVETVQKHIATKGALGDELISRLRPLLTTEFVNKYLK